MKLVLLTFLVIVRALSIEKGKKTAGKAGTSDTPPVTHFKCRNNVYCGININISRFPVPDDKVSWEVKWPDYNPVNFTDDSIRVLREFDPEIEGTINLIKFNTIDEKGVNRISYWGYYTIENSYPLNPMGRTGVRGRGTLPRWGPNHMVYSIISRYKPSENVLSEEPRTGQFLAIRNGNGKGIWGMIGGFISSGENIHTSPSKQTYLDQCTKHLNLSDSDKLLLINLLDINSGVGDKIAFGYQDDPSNTDNAWTELTIKYLHDIENSLFTGVPEADYGDDITLRWVDIHKKVSSIEGITLVLENIASSLKCKW